MNHGHGKVGLKDGTETGSGIKTQQKFVRVLSGEKIPLDVGKRPLRHRHPWFKYASGHQ